MKSYRRFIGELEETLVEAVAWAENLGWHHLTHDTELFRHYLRLVTWAEEVSLRRQWFDYYTTTRRPKASRRKNVAELAAQDGLDRFRGDLSPGQRDARFNLTSGDDDPRQQHRDDLDS